MRLRRLNESEEVGPKLILREVAVPDLEALLDATGVMSEVENLRLQSQASKEPPLGSQLPIMS